MRRTCFTDEERDNGFCQVFVDSVNGPVLTWFSRLVEDSIGRFHELSTQFLKHHTRFIRKRSFSHWPVEDVLEANKEPKESLIEFIENFKADISKVHVPDGTAVEAPCNTLWINSKFCEDICTNSTISRMPYIAPTVSSQRKKIRELSCSNITKWNM